MRWPKPDEPRRWTAEDQTVLRKWRQAVFTFYGVAIGLLIFTATLAMRHNERVQPDSVTRSETSLNDPRPSPTSTRGLA